MSGWRMMREAITADRLRLRAYFEMYESDREQHSWPRLGSVATVLYRLGRYLHEAGWRLPARLVWLLNICLTGADIDPRSAIGAGLAIPYPRTVTIYGTVGAGCLFLGQTGIGGTVRERRGLPTIGNGVVVQPGSLVLGPTIVGDGVRIGPRCVVTKDVPPGADVTPSDWRR